MMTLKSGSSNTSEVLRSVATAPKSRNAAIIWKESLKCLNAAWVPKVGRKKSHRARPPKPHSTPGLFHREALHWTVDLMGSWKTRCVVNSATDRPKWVTTILSWEADQIQANKTYTVVGLIICFHVVCPSAVLAHPNSKTAWLVSTAAPLFEHQQGFEQASQEMSPVELQKSREHPEAQDSRNDKISPNSPRALASLE